MKPKININFEEFELLEEKHRESNKILKRYYNLRRVREDIDKLLNEK